MYLQQDIAVVSSQTLAKSAGIQSVTKKLFEDVFPIFFLNKENENELKLKLDSFGVVLFSGFDYSFVEMARHLKGSGKKIAVFWHFSSAHEVDIDIGDAWRSLVPLMVNHEVDLFITCKKGLDRVIEELYHIPAFFILNNAMDTSYLKVPKKGLGIYSGSSDYWAKNLRPNLYAALMTGIPTDILPYDDTLKSVVNMLGKSELVTGTKERLEHEAFMKRLASRELVSYVTFVEGSPILPLEALNNGVICLTGNNHHYFANDKRLRDLLVVNQPDNPEAIYNAILNALENKQEILDMYKDWKSLYDILQNENFTKFIDCLASL